MKNLKILLKGHIVNPDTVTVEPGYAAVSGEQIIYSGPLKPEDNFERSLEFGSCYICPGFIDMHTHGAGGRDVMDGSIEALEEMSLSLAKGGTTSFLATTMAAPHEELLKIVENVARYALKGGGSLVGSIKGAQIMGIHLEGPFLNPKRKGAQKEEYLRAPNLNEINDLIKCGDGLIRIITMAPELSGAVEVIKHAKARGIMIALGHSDATFEQVCEAAEAGLSHVSHSFNAMKELHHRDPGVVGALLGLEQLTADVIPDGIHVHPAVIKILLQAKGLNNVCAVTDSIRACGLTDGEYELGGQKVTVTNGVSLLKDGTISGSVLTMAGAVRNLIKKVGVSLPDAVKMVSGNPARLMGLKRKGCVSAGMDADIVVLDREFNVVMTMVRGRVVYSTLTGC